MRRCFRSARSESGRSAANPRRPKGTGTRAIDTRTLVLMRLLEPLMGLSLEPPRSRGDKASLDPNVQTRLGSTPEAKAEAKGQRPGEDGRDIPRSEPPGGWDIPRSEPPAGREIPRSEPPAGQERSEITPPRTSQYEQRKTKHKLKPRTSKCGHHSNTNDTPHARSKHGEGRQRAPRGRSASAYESEFSKTGLTPASDLETRQTRASRAESQRRLPSPLLVPPRDSVPLPRPQDQGFEGRGI